MPTEGASIPAHGMLACYYAVQFGKTLLWVAADLIAFYVLATVDHLPADDIALVLIGGLAWHALSDVAVGQWLEQRQGRSRSLAMIAGLSVPIASASFVVSLLLAPYQPWVALAAMMVSRSAYALFDVPHHALIGRMARRGWPTVRIVGIRNLWGQVASLVLGLGLAPALGPDMTNMTLVLTLAGIAGVSASSSMPIVLLLLRLWDGPVDGLPIVPGSGDAPVLRIVGVLLLHLGMTLLVASTNKIALVAMVPGVALATISAGRISASIPVPARWRERRLGIKLCCSVLLLLAAIALLCLWPAPASLFAFGLASGWINILTWAWLSRATDHPRPFASAVMLTKIGLLLSIPIANVSGHAR